MRTLARTLEYLMLAAMVLGVAYYGLSTVGHKIGDSINQSAMLIDNAGSGR